VVQRFGPILPSEQVRYAVMTVLGDPRYRQKARDIQAEITSHDAQKGGAFLSEYLAETKEPVQNYRDVLGRATG
jgi:UDP:flavonoid glycosyltransferase YjiC (YdhE family)